MLGRERNKLKDESEKLAKASRRFSSRWTLSAFCSVFVFGSEGELFHSFRCLYGVELIYTYDAGRFASEPFLIVGVEGTLWNVSLALMLAFYVSPVLTSASLTDSCFAELRSTMDATASFRSGCERRLHRVGARMLEQSRNCTAIQPTRQGFRRLRLSVLLFDLVEANPGTSSVLNTSRIPLEL